ncbi:unnamed protein product [Paramecium sonneborni]|uniref:Uncharacterized protein n=1 Tax=Paramecium sonneborni TaxID=65129 RepID=A0A8S1L384_9CILI|nr:unnamed protein product [Paramecium sonneborni]
MLKQKKIQNKNIILKEMMFAEGKTIQQLKEERLEEGIRVFNGKKFEHIFELFSFDECKTIMEFEECIRIFLTQERLASQQIIPKILDGQRCFIITQIRILPSKYESKQFYHWIKSN